MMGVMKTVHRLMSALMMTLLVGSTASSAFAVTQSKQKTAKKPAAEQPINQTQTAPIITLSDSQNKASHLFQFDIKNRWGLKFDINQPETKPSGSNDIDAGAYFKLTPSLRVGGTLGFGEKTKSFQPEAEDPNKKQPRVRLETQFKF
jgi:hypothetical protein